MPNTILKVDKISKQYRLGLIGTGTLRHDLNRWWHSIRGKEDPFLQVGEVNDRSVKGDSDYVWALQDISFEVEKGEVLGIVGKNGAGKSTLLKILSRVTAPTKGEVKTKGDIASLLEVGTGFHPEMTGRENIFLNGAILGMTKREIKQKLEEIIAFSGCARYIDTPVKRYSIGMRVRLAFSVAAFLEPDILVVDEVLAVGDAEFQKKAIGKMQDISQGDGRTVLFVSHDMTSIEALCSRVIVLQNGRIALIDTPQKAIEFYLKSDQTDDEINYVNVRGDKQYYIKKATINGSHNRNNLVKSGSPIKMKFELNKELSKEELKKIAFYLIIKNELQSPVLTLSNMYDSNFDDSKESSRFLECEIDGLNLSEGRYFVTTWLTFNNALSNQINDSFVFEVIQTDFYKTGKMPNPRKHGYMLLNQKWSSS
ncbi:ABC transporter ATP-binding protein [Winogradskyella ouciana]|uniref:ATP-binding cassette domain-containing protein n=1 Tax=Winogradskyella ouciana TaxID=2608631 RepID=A0A7K1GDK0_9FLAO|nr:ABC transporter ATP-binding protein [Winogradskyella ouciana]MTE27387.1 ATP-binding cassette domain-containing protein [Winogradskyella ouciana]